MWMRGAHPVPLVFVLQVVPVADRQAPAREAPRGVDPKAPGAADRKAPEARARHRPLTAGSVREARGTGGRLGIMITAPFATP